MGNELMLIQPSYSKADLWSALAEREGFSYEVLELSMPSCLDNDVLSKTVISHYKASGRVKAIHGAFIDVNPASGDRAFAELSRRRCEESCAQAAALGAEYVIFHGSCFPFLRGAYLENWVAGCADFYLQLAERWNLCLCIENSLDLDTRPLQALMEKCSCDKVRVCLDLGHANYSHIPMEKWFDVLGEYIAYIHLSDNMGCFDEHLPLGSGTVDWCKADSLYRGLGKALPMTLEVGGVENVEKSFAFLKERGYFGLGD